MLGQLHWRVKQTHDPVFHDPGDGDGATVANMLLERTRLFAWRDVGVGKARFGRKLVVQNLPALGPQVGLGGRHWDSPSVGGNNEDRRLVDVSEHVGNLFVLAVVPPDHPDLATRWHLGKHPERAVTAFIELVNAVEGGLDLLGGEPVSGDLLQVPFDPLESPHAISISRGCSDRQGD